MMDRVGTIIPNIIRVSRRERTFRNTSSNGILRHVEALENLYVGCGFHLAQHQWKFFFREADGQSEADLLALLTPERF